MARPNPTRDVRVYAILARDAERAVVFRRGPSKQVLLLSWDTARDLLEDGQWLKGRIYERRCDLSPDGRFLLYFAASYRKPYYSWSAISRPPFLSALALWPKGDGWGGGGEFQTSDTVLLNHRQNEMQLAPEFALPEWLHVRPFGEHSGRAEDEPLWSHRMERDGWTLAQDGRPLRNTLRSRVLIEFDPPIVWEKPHPLWPHRYRLRMSISGLKENNGPWYLIEHSVLEGDTEVLSLGRSDWADWSHQGDLLYAKRGNLFRLRRARKALPPIGSSIVVAGLTSLSFEERVAPPEFRRWPVR